MARLPGGHDLSDKQKRVQSIMAEKPSNLHYIPVDFTEDGWELKLTACPVFEQNKISFCSLLGMCYYLPKQTFTRMISIILNIVPKGSSIVFDYPDEDTYTSKAGERIKKQVAMAAAANEKMLAGYSYLELEQLLGDSNFLIYEHLTPKQITEQFFEKYNQSNPQHPITAFDNVNYCLAVKG
ncbi:MAG: class I SAM-dependent methyltransferase [Acetivibrionales bacterium]|jgi:O-methyltransferase involved in polyketide biosynthesis